MTTRLLIYLFFLTSIFSAWTQTNTVDFLSVDATLDIDTETQSVIGVATYRFNVLQPRDTVFLDAHNMRLRYKNYEESKSVLIATADKIGIINQFVPGQEYTVSLTYEATPKQTMYFFGEQVWTQGQGKYTSHWLPSIDDVNDKIIFNLSVLVPPGTTALTNGVLYNKEAIGEKILWQYQMQQPMSSYLVALVIGNFEKQVVSSQSGIPIELYLPPDEIDKFEPTYRYTQTLFDFLEREIGVAYPWEIYKQVPVRDFLYAGMENTTLTVFASSLVVDSIGFNDANYVYVNAHELAHHWFGNLVTATSEEHHWLQEGFATFYGLLAAQEVLGEDYLYAKLIETAQELENHNLPDQGEAILDTGNSYLTYYFKGAWALYALRHYVGEEGFTKGVKSYLNTYQFGSATTDQFLNAIAPFTPKDLTDFKNKWLLNPGFPTEEVNQLLSEHSVLYRDWMRLEDLESAPWEEKLPFFKQIITKYQQPLIIEKLFSQISSLPEHQRNEWYQFVLQTDHLYARQLLAFQLDFVPANWKEKYENLLEDASYLTKERALLHLWISFPEDQVKYLQQTAHINGFQNKNIRLLWLVLNLATAENSNQQKLIYFEELSSYTSPEFSFEIRQEAFSYLYELDALGTQNLIDLVQAGLHPNWRFSSFAREKIRQMLASEDYRQRLNLLLEVLPEKEKAWLQTQMDYTN